MNNRNKLFLDTFYEHGIGAAMKVANYTKRHSYRILATQKAKEYLLNLAKQTIDELGLTHTELIRKRLAIADDPETPAKVRADILKDLAEMLEKTEQEPKPGEVRLVPKLTPSKQPIKDAV